MEGRFTLYMKIKMIGVVLDFIQNALELQRAHKTRLTSRFKTKGTVKVTDIGDLDVEALVSHDSIVPYKKITPCGVIG